MRDPLGEGYDAWKTSAPKEPAAPENREELSDCCGVPRDQRYETDFCSGCHEHASFSAFDEDEGYDSGPLDTLAEKEDDR